MSAIRRRGLQLDDPLGPGNASQREKPAHDPTVAATPPAPIYDSQAGATNPVAETGRRGQQEGTSRPPTVRPPERAARKHPVHEGGEVWRAWSGITGVGSFRVPHELLVELGDAARELQLPIGMIVAAAITQLLDQPPQTIAALVDLADDARIQGRRSARRRQTDRAGG